MLQFDLSSPSRVVGSGESYPSFSSSNPSSSSYSASYGDDARSGCGDKCCACAGTCPLARSSFNTCFAIGDNLMYSFTLVVGCGDIDARRVGFSAKYCGDGGPRPNDGDGGFLGVPIDVIDRHLSFKSTFDRIDSVDAYFRSRLITAQLPTPCSVTPALSARVSASLHTLYNFRLFFLFCATTRHDATRARLRQSPSHRASRAHAHARVQPTVTPFPDSPNSPNSPNASPTPTPRPRPTIDARAHQRLHRPRNGGHVHQSIAGRVHPRLDRFLRHRASVRPSVVGNCRRATNRAFARVHMRAHVRDFDFQGIGF